MGASNAFSTVPKASAQPGELFVSAVPREPRARAKLSDEKRRNRAVFSPQECGLYRLQKILVCEALYQGTSLLVP